MTIAITYALLLLAYSLADILSYVMPAAGWAGETVGYMTYLGFGLFNPLVGIAVSIGLLLGPVRASWAFFDQFAGGLTVEKEKQVGEEFLLEILMSFLKGMLQLTRLSVNFLIWSSFYTGKPLLKQGVF